MTTRRIRRSCPPSHLAARTCTGRFLPSADAKGTVPFASVARWENADRAPAAGDRALPRAVAFERPGGVDEQRREDQRALAGLGRRCVRPIGPAGEAGAEPLGHLDDDEGAERQLELARGRVHARSLRGARQRPQAGHGAVPSRASSAAAMRSCSASGAAAGSPVPPIARHVARENWYLPRYRPPGEIAVGSPPDSHWAIRCSVLEADREDDADGVVAAGALPSPSAALVCGPTMPSTGGRWPAWKRRTARAVTGPKLPVGETPSIRWSADTAGPELPRCSTPPAEAS